jgi:asparagine synthase (glutamine-hydrolysing)
MCGIAGFYSDSLSLQELKLITDSMFHRGPDAGGYELTDHCGLGHRRLSIIDLSEAANQPMVSHSGKLIMVFNGEIYNYQEIAEDLVKQNPSMKFNTHSDTEVILEAFNYWGPSFVNRMNGMFAIAIYDTETRKLFLFRDRMGIKPIFYYHNGETLVFASELKAIMSLPQVKSKTTINKQAIVDFLHVGYIPAPRTIYNEVKKFPKASYAIFDGKEFTIQQWWNVNEKITATTITDEVEAKQKLKELILSSVKYRLISDVPFGTFLSGGTDSSVVTAVAQHVASEPVKTFSIGFEDAKFNEAPFAKEVANYLGTKHHEFTVSYRDALDLIPELPKMYDEPYSDSSAIPTYLVSKMAKQHVTMTLSGDGGDELFFGYGAYLWANRLNSPLLKMGHNLASKALLMGSSKYKRVSQLLNYNKSTFLPSHIFSQEQYFFSMDEISSILKNPEAKVDFPEYQLITTRDLSAAEKQSLFDLHYYLPDDLLVKVDRATMQNSLETRVPLLDYRIVEFALSLDSSLKNKNGVSKYLLKEVLYDFVPKSLFDRPKWGFSIPLGKWMQNELKSYIESYLFEENDYIDSKQVRALYQRFLNGEHYLYNRIWVIFILNRFLKELNG